jgi:hypothetical protein
LKSSSEVAMQTQQQQGQGTRGQQPSPPSDPRQQTVRIPLAVNEWATLQAAFPLTEAAWTQMKTVLDAMKPGLVVPPEAPSEASHGATDDGNGEPVA